jgi:hypothetical protein
MRMISSRILRRRSRRCDPVAAKSLKFCYGFKSFVEPDWLNETRI